MWEYGYHDAMLDALWPKGARVYFVAGACDEYRFGYQAAMDDAASRRQMPPCTEPFDVRDEKARELARKAGVCEMCQDEFASYLDRVVDSRLCEHCHEHQNAIARTDALCESVRDAEMDTYRSEYLEREANNV